MGGVTRVGRGAISQTLLLPKEGGLTGQEWCAAVPKSLLNPPRTGSKTERHGVQKTLVEVVLRGFLLFKTSKMVTFGHHFEITPVERVFGRGDLHIHYSEQRAFPSQHSEHYGIS